METKTTIIPVASGKGGVGKSIFTANIAIALARMGHSTVAVDMDLGGSNLYTCLGLPNAYPGIGDYLRARNVDFNDLIVQTNIPNLSFVPGDGKTPFMANISYDQRLALIREIRKISARYVLLDLGAGTVFNTLNFFGLSQKGLIITNFETSSIMNFVMFLRNFIFRVLSSIVREDKKVLKMMITAFQQPIRSEPLTMKFLLSRIGEMNPKLAEKAQKICESYRPRIVFNMGDHPDELNVVPKLQASIREGLSLDVDFLGFVFSDDTVRLAAKNRQTLLIRYPRCIASIGIERIAARIANAWEDPMVNAQAILTEDAKRQYNHWKSIKKKEHTQNKGKPPARLKRLIIPEDYLI